MFAEKGLWSLSRTYATQMKLRFPGDSRIDALASEIAKAIKTLLANAADLLNTGAIEEARRKLYEYLSLVKDDASAEAIGEKIDTHDRERAGAMIQPESIRMSVAQKKDLYQRVQDCLEMGAIEKAIGVLEGLVQIEDENAWRPREKIGDIRLSQKDVVSAQWHYRQALELSPHNAELDSKLHMTLQQTENGANLMENTTANRITCRTDPQSQLETPEEMYGQAQAQIEQDVYPEAVQILEKLLAEYPDFGLAHNDLGVLNYKLGNREKSFFHYREAARIDPNNPVFQKNLADFHYVVRGEVQPALENYVDLLSKNALDQETLLALGHICMDQEKFDDAMVFYQRILDIDPENAEANRALAELSDRSGHVGQDSTQARAHGASAKHDVLDVQAAPILPSPVVKTEINTNNRRCVVQIPGQEMFRIASIFEQKEYAVMDKRRRDGIFNVFDVGANIGLFALWVHDRHPHSKIYCFEPSPATQMLLEENVGELSEMVICEYGLYNRDIQTPMYIHQYNTGQNSIRFNGRNHNGTVDVQVMDAGRQFDALGLSHLDILKIDTEGCEVEILESMGERLDNVDYILLEYHSEKDRRAIDGLLRRFHLFGARSDVAGIGTVKYVHPSLV
jgi:FkbM family methyltransferase